MKQQKPTLSIGITAFNEEQAFPSILQKLLAQESSSFILEYVYVVSDGSTDETVNKLKSFNHQKVQLLPFSKRMGKANRINTIFKKATSDIVVLLDADITIKDDWVLEKLIKPFLNDEKVLGVSGSILPIPPQSFTQNVLFTGSRLWDKTRALKKADVYYCTGAIRAFKKKLYKEMQFPDISAEDVYPYLYCKLKGYQFRIVKNAIVYYGLPLTYRDYFMQMRRYLKSGAVQENLFNEELINREYTIRAFDRLNILLREILHNPFWTTLYLLFLIPVQVANQLSKSDQDDAIWKIATSSKKTIS